MFLLWCKLPTTRAKSPKLGRRKSCSDTTDPSPGENKNNNGACVRATRHSLGSYKVGNKLQSNAKNASPVLKDKEGSKLVREGNKSLPRKVTEQMNADISVQSWHLLSWSYFPFKGITLVILHHRDDSINFSLKYLVFGRSYLLLREPVARICVM